MPRAEHRPERFTQLDFDPLAPVVDETPADNGRSVTFPDIQPFSGTRHQFVRMPGGIQYTLDAALSAQSAQEGEGAAGQAGPRHEAIQPFSGT